MKKFFTLCFGLLAALAVQAQSDFPVQFADADGNIIADGTTLELTAFEVDIFGGVEMPSTLFAKNTSSDNVQIGGIYTINSMANGAFQTCFPENCVQKSAMGSYTTESGVIAGGDLKDMKTEWKPDAEGTCVVAYQLATFKQNPITKAWMVDKKGPTVTLNFTYDPAGITTTEASKRVARVEYYSPSGQRVQKPVRGICVVKTTYADGTTKSVKLSR